MVLDVLLKQDVPVAYTRAHITARVLTKRDRIGKALEVDDTRGRPRNRPRDLHSRRRPGRAQQRHLPAPKPGPARDAVAGGHATRARHLSRRLAATSYECVRRSPGRGTKTAIETLEDTMATATEIGHTGLQGWRGKVADRISEPVAKPCSARRGPGTGRRRSGFLRPGRYLRRQDHLRGCAAGSRLALLLPLRPPVRHPLPRLVRLRAHLAHSAWICSLLGLSPRWIASISVPHLAADGHRGHQPDHQDE